MDISLQTMYAKKVFWTPFNMSQEQLEPKIYWFCISIYEELSA